MNFLPSFHKPKFYHINKQAWSQSYSLLDKSIVSHFEERGIKDEECIAFVKSAYNSSQTRYVIFKEGKVLLDSKSYSIKWLTSENIKELSISFREIETGEAPYAPLVLLGSAVDNKEANYFAVEAKFTAKSKILSMIKDTMWVKPRALLVGEMNAPEELAILGQAAARLNWITNNKYSSRDGTLLRTAALGHRLVSEKGNKTYPTVSPVAIVLVLNKARDKILLGERTPLRGSGFFTCVAGFVEQGESVENAAKREVLEESGIIVEDQSIQVVGTQPWPIGTGGNCELMIGCVANAITEDINFAPDEMARMRWFTKAEARKMVENSFVRKRDMWKKSDTFMEDVTKFAVPPHTAIAHHLINSWVDNKHLEAKNSQPKITATAALTVGTVMGVIGSVLFSSM